MLVRVGELLMKKNTVSPQVTFAILELPGAVIPAIEAVQALPDTAHNLVWVRS
jgi:hypothetical protein